MAAIEDYSKKGKRVKVKIVTSSKSRTCYLGEGQGRHVKTRLKNVPTKGGGGGGRGKSRIISNRRLKRIVKRRPTEPGNCRKATPKEKLSGKGGG